MRPSIVRRKPCATCPYRRDVPSGIWAPAEYERLPRFDGEIAEQVNAGALRPFHCHSATEQVCAGWAGHRDPFDLLAVRLGINTGQLDPSVRDYQPDPAIPLWTSGADAAAHGLRDIDAPDEDARRAVEKLVRINPDRLKGQ